MLLAIWQRAQADGALTDLGGKLGPDLMKLNKANALLGVGVPAVATPGYGNLTQIGIAEHTQLAQRFLARLPGYFASVASAANRQVVVLSSGQDRAVDSAAVFASTLATTEPSLASLIVHPAGLTGYPANAPVVQPDGINRFLCYFHKLAPKTDLVTDITDKYFAAYTASQAFQSFASNQDMTAKVSAILATDDAKAARIAYRSHFYDYAGLKTCYGR